MQQLIDINARVNGAISPASDVEAFGANDVWALPLEDGGPARGNCKHYALEKQHALTVAGLPASNLSLAIVRTRWGELHAVLLVRTDQGELVLDNLTSSIRSWRDVDYTWIERQKPDEPLVWVALATASSGRG
jgi:predicted transglutaminase-like cysteine proteinase